MKNYENVIFPENCRGIIDVTRPPYNLDNTGREDCTTKLCALIDTLMSRYVDEVKHQYDALIDAPDGTDVCNARGRKRGGRVWVIDFGERIFTPTIYFPNGTYLVSDTVSYSLRNLRNHMLHYHSGGFEFCSSLRFMGQSREGTIIKLKDNCPGFEFGQERPVISFMRGERSNVCYGNYFENITLDIGSGNPGAVGIVHFANNFGAVRNVTVRSSDPNGDGAIGILIDSENHSACNVYDVKIDGFDNGIMLRTFRTVAHFENITLNRPKRYGIVTGNVSSQFIGVKGHGNVPMLCMEGNCALAHVVLKDAEFTSDGTIYYAAVKKEVGGCLYLKNINTSGFAAALEENWFERTLPDGYIDEFCSSPGYTLFGGEASSLDLTVPPLPDEAMEQDMSEWLCVDDCGAKGDGVTDDTEAVQRAMNSGKPVVWFQPAKYLITRPVTIPPSVRYVHFMFCDIAAGEEIRRAADDAIFRIAPGGGYLLIEKLFSWHGCTGEMRMFRNDSTRTVHFRDILTETCAFYFNTLPGGEIFLENCGCTIGDKSKYSYIPGFYFKGQTVWCHSINPERSMLETVNDGGQLWWSGFKTEQEGTITATFNGGVTEILGGVAVVGAGSDQPLIINDNSTVSAIFSTTGAHEHSSYPVAVRETQNGVTREIRDSELPARVSPWYFMPLYSGRKK